MYHLRNHTCTVEDIQKTPPASTGQDWSKWSILSGLGDVFLAIFGGGSSGGPSKATISKVKKTLHILQEN